MSGDFTNRFDREILKSEMAKINTEKLKEAEEKKEAERIDVFLEDIDKLLARRAAFVTERFKNSTAVDLPGAGFQYSFKADGKLKAADFSITARINDSRMAVHVESFYEIPDVKAKEKDYITIPLQKLDLDRAKRFIESKLLDFARLYSGG